MKIILEYANRLVEAGHNVNIVYPGTINWLKSPVKYKLKSLYYYFRHKRIGVTCSTWFKMDKRVKEFHPLNLEFHNIPKSDIYVATEVRTAPYVAKYPVPANQKFYFIQDFENWYMSDDAVIDTYHLPLQKIVISSWLSKILNQINEKSILVPNGFDFNYFSQTVPFEERDRNVVSMLYHEAPRKDCKMAFKALDIVKSKYPNLQVLIFGTPNRPNNLPSWYKYYQCPTKVQHNFIYNNSAIFIGSSIAEGWGLTVGEAMICGAAIACTDNEGYKEMAKHNHNALISPIHDANSLANNIIQLITDDNLRIRLARTAAYEIHNFTWNNSFKCFTKALKLQ